MSRTAILDGLNIALNRKDYSPTQERHRTAALPDLGEGQGIFDLRGIVMDCGSPVPLFSAVLCALFFLCGCKPSPHSNTAFESSIFEKVEVIGRRGTGVGEFNKPRSLAVDSADNLYVVDMTGRVQKFSPEGKYLLMWQMPQTDKGKPKGMCCDSDGNIVVLEPHYSRVNHHAPDGRLLRQWGVHGTNEGQLAFPRSVAVDSKGPVFVSEYGLRERVQAFSGDGTKWLWAIGEAGSENGQFNRAEGLAIDGQGRLFVADSCNHRIQIFSTDGQWLASYGAPGAGKGELSYPYDVRVDHAGFQFVCEFGNSRIQVFDSQNRAVEIIGHAGSAPGEFSNPWSIGLDSQGNLYVADANNHRVQKLVRRKVQVTSALASSSRAP